MPSHRHLNKFNRFIVPSTLTLGFVTLTIFACNDATTSDDDADSGTSSGSDGDSGSVETPPLGGDSGGATDSGHDASHLDAGDAAARALDAGDSGVSDSGKSDSGMTDSGASDSGVKDSGTPDTGTPDTGAPDSGGGTGGYDGGLSPATCIERTQTQYLLRNDGKLLFDDGKTPVTDAATGFPLENVTSVADGTYHGCASTSDGKALCWRLNTGTAANNSGQLGNGTTGDTGALYRATPVLVGAGKLLTKVATMADGTAETTGASGHGYSSCAITTEGKAYCWGDLGSLVNNGTDLSSPYAQLITVDGINPLLKIKQMAYTGAYACGVVQGAAKNEVWCWGDNNDYNLGQGDLVERQYPTKVLGLTNPTQVAIANGYGADGTTCAIDGGVVKCWGNNSYGACGNDSADFNCVNPVTVLGPAGTPLDKVVQLAGSGGDYPSMCALRDNAVWCWGYSYAKHAGTIGVPNVVGLASRGVLTDDNVFHPFPVSSGKKVTPFCGSL